VQNPYSRFDFPACYAARSPLCVTITVTLPARCCFSPYPGRPGWKPGRYWLSNCSGHGKM